MKSACSMMIVTILCSLQFVGAATAQAIPRIGKTRPGVICNLPPANYQIGNRSASITAFSNRFVYLDDPLTHEFLPEGARIQQNSKSTTVTKSIDVSESLLSNNLPDPAASLVNSSNPEPEHILPAEGQNDSSSVENAVTTVDTANSELSLPSMILNNSLSAIQPGEMTEKTTVKNQTASSRESLSAGDIQRNIKLFQWSRGTIQIDHCSISNMSLQLARNGIWALNLRADQNPLPPEGVAAPFNPVMHIKRNRFAIRLRCYGAMDTTPPEIGLQTGKPVLATINVNEFWVENGQPRFLLACQSDPCIQQNFDLIDRVEIEFFYYR